MSEPSTADPQHFVANILPLYHGPQVKIRIKPSNAEFTISQDLLCAQSPVFSAMFKGEFLETQQQAVDLEDMKDVVSVQSLEALFQWLYRGAVNFDIENPREHISAAMELVRLADKYEILALEDEMAQYIKHIIITAKAHPSAFLSWRIADINTHWLTTDHIDSATYLPLGHPVRRTLAAASVRGYLQSDKHKFAQETQDYPSFGADVLQEVRLTLNGIRLTGGNNFGDPISGERLPLNFNVSESEF
ncbi:uncharacterized protein N7529_001481 [Penicillium soppii]|uniref:uncharacterized protein n=1 Tax=Penicillium soppii TaxID=69789 RepID=UPI00254922AD|nr:uncharacterized protein N7529_001481 [Penicillium soppii]KAJ5875897.1 hypothetical protein N7529_001481 [Penicillium soppii]